MITTSTQPPYAKGLCKVHVRQTLGDTLYEAQVYFDVQIFDNNGAELGSNQGEVNWGEAFVIGSMLTDPLNVTPQSHAVEKRSKDVEKVGGAIPIGRPLLEDGPVEFAIFDQAWDTSSSQCQVGGWDHGSGADWIDPSPEQGFPVSSTYYVWGILEANM